MFMPYKLPPLHFVLKGTNSIPNITDIENSSRSILPVHNITPPIIRVKRNRGTLSKLNPLWRSYRRPNPLLTSYQLNLVSLPKLKSTIILSPKHFTIGPIRCQLSNQKEVEWPSPIRLHMNRWVRLQRPKIFLQRQEQFPGQVTSQMTPCNK